MEIKLNGKTLAAIIAFSATFTFANYVTIIDGKSSKFTVAEKTLSEEDMANAILNSMPIGSITFRMDAQNPSTIYGGSWKLITGDATVAFGNGSVQTLTPIGNNTPVVPIPQHTHTAKFVGNKLPNHSHSLPNGYNANANSGTNAFQGASTYSNSTRTSSSVSAGTPTGTVTVSNTGTANAKLDVRGARILLNVWQRIG